MRLFLDIGHHDGAVRRGGGRGRTIAVVSESPAGIDHGALLACAEAIPERPDAEEAAKGATAALNDVYAAAIEAAAPHQALGEGLNAANSAARAGGARGRGVALAALVLQGRQWLVGHAGNVRAWRCRDLQLKQLTRDHVAPRVRGGADVTRACGMGDTLEPDYDQGEMQEGDLFLLTSPGVHDTLSGPAMLGVLQSNQTAQQMAETLVQRALGARTAGYAGACVARVEKLPPATGAARPPAELPIIDLPEPGTTRDGFTIGKLMVQSRRFRLYQAQDQESGQTVALRFPDPGLGYGAQAFLREEWAGRRIDSPYVLKPIALRPGRRTALYTAFEYRRAQNVAKRIRRKQGFSLPETMRLGGQLLAALEVLHGHGLIHGDIRANSLLYDGANRQLWMLGVGTERGEDCPEDIGKLRSSTLSYWAPELFGGARAGERSDIYAAGATIYRMLTASYPYGRIRTRADWAQPREYIAAARYREGLPRGIDDVLERACAVDPGRRYATVAQFTAALESAALAAGAARTYEASQTSPTSGRWTWVLASGLVAALLAYLYYTLR